eukprot:751329-Hanusia_phi.AAC.1
MGSQTPPGIHSDPKPSSRSSMAATLEGVGMRGWIDEGMRGDEGYGKGSMAGEVIVIDSESAGEGEEARRRGIGEEEEIGTVKEAGGEDETRREGDGEGGRRIVGVKRVRRDAGYGEEGREKPKAKVAKTKTPRSKRSNIRAKSAFAKGDCAFSCPICGLGFHVEREITMHVEWCAAREERKMGEGEQWPGKMIPADQRDPQNEGPSDATCVRTHLGVIKPSSLNVDKDPRPRKGEPCEAPPPAPPDVPEVQENEKRKTEKNKTRMEKLKLKKKSEDHQPHGRSTPAAHDGCIPHLKVTSFFSEVCKSEPILYGQLQHQKPLGDEQIARLASQGFHTVAGDVKQAIMRSLRARSTARISPFSLPLQESKVVAGAAYRNFWAQDVYTTKLVYHEFPR